MFTNPTIAEFKAFFVRDFPYGSDPDQNVIDGDLDRASLQASFNINPSIFETQTEYTLAFNLLMAHYLVMNLRTSSQGLSGKFEWLTASKSVGSVSISEAIPQKILDNPLFSVYASTGYGVQYLLMVYPRALGAVYTISGGTLA